MTLECIKTFLHHDFLTQTYINGMFVSALEMPLSIIIKVRLLLGWHVRRWMWTSLNRFKFKSFWYSHHSLLEHQQQFFTAANNTNQLSKITISYTSPQLAVHPYNYMLLQQQRKRNMSKHYNQIRSIVSICYILRCQSACHKFNQT